MRVAVYIPSLSVEEGGACTLEQDIFQNLLKQAPSSSHEFLIYSYGAENLKSLAKSPNVRFIELKRERLRMRALRKLIHRTQDWLFDRRWIQLHSWFEKSLRRENAQLVYYTTNRFESCELPYLYTILDIENFTMPGYPEVTENGEWERRRDFYYEVAPKAAHVIAANESGKKQIVEHLRIDASRITPLPYVASSFALQGTATPKDPSIRKKYSIQQDFIFYPAKCYAHKNHIGILHGLKKLKDKHGIRLDVIFSGPDGGNRAYVQKVAKQLGLENSVHFPGFIPLPDIVQLYKNAVAMTYMSFFGPSNIPSLEAMALGCPVINADAVGAREELGDAALLVDPADENALADAIAKIYKDQNLRADLIKKGLLRAERWTIQDYVRGVLNILDSYEKQRRTWA